MRACLERFLSSWRRSSICQRSVRNASSAAALPLIFGRLRNRSVRYACGSTALALQLATRLYSMAAHSPPVLLPTWRGEFTTPLGSGRDRPRSRRPSCSRASDVPANAFYQKQGLRSNPLPRKPLESRADWIRTSDLLTPSFVEAFLAITGFAATFGKISTSADRCKWLIRRKWRDLTRNPIMNPITIVAVAHRVHVNVFGRYAVDQRAGEVVRTGRQRGERADGLSDRRRRIENAPVQHSNQGRRRYSRCQPGRSGPASGSRFRK